MIEKHNFHWREGFYYNFPKKRALFETIAGELGSKQIISLSGLRRTGKTTILKQLIDQLIREGVGRENILSYTFDEEQPKIEAVFQEYEALLGKTIMGRKERIYVFLDEIQKLENWQNQVKYYYDNYNNIKFLVSGSSSLFIKKHVQESLAGRIYEFALGPLNFMEFIIFRGGDDMLKNIKLFHEDLKKEFLAYQKRQFIDIINENEENAGLYIKTMIEKIIYQDIPKIFPIENEELLMRILRIIASNPGLFSNYGELSKEIGVNRITLSNYFFYLEEAFLITKMYNFSKNMLTSEKKMKRFYLATTSFFLFLNNDIEESRLVENLAAVFTGARFFWRTPQKYEVDVVLRKNGKILPVEVKYRENISKNDAKNLLRFCTKFNVEDAIMVTKDEEDEKEYNAGGLPIKIRFIPMWKFLLEEAF